MGDLLTLAKRCEEIAERANEYAHGLKIEAASAMLEYLVEETPVDTSEALSNWQVNLGRAPSDGAELPPYVPGKRGSTAALSRARAIEVGKARLAASKPGEAVYLSNVVDHIRKLNNGSSRQHPGGFVEAAVLIGREFIKSVTQVRLRK